MSRIYTVVASGTYTAAGGDIDLLSLQPADDKPVALLGWSIGQHTEVADAGEENIRISVLHMTTAVTIGSGGSAPTPTNVDDPAGTAAGFTARVLDTTVSTTTGTSRTVQEHGWNERATPYDFFYPDITYAPKARQTEVLIVRGQTTVADDVTVDLTFWVLEN